MTIRGGRGPRDPRVPAPLYDADDYATDDAAWAGDPRWSAYDRRSTSGHGLGLGGLLRFLVFALVLGGVVLTVMLTALRPIFADAVVGWGYDNPSALRIPFVADLVRERLGDALTAAPSQDDTAVTFTVRQGDTIESLAQRLHDQGFVNDPRAFIFQATVRDLATVLQAGNFSLSRGMTPDELVTGLIENRITIVVVPMTFRESLRIAQMAAFIQTWEPPLTVDSKQFYDLAMKPTPELLADYPWLATSGLPEGASLEGYLFPSTYDLKAETTAEDLIRMMLDRFAAEVGPEPLADASFYERLILASIVEREARVQEERALIAGVYQNRLNSEGPERILNADPTVLYALDTLQLQQLVFDDWHTYFFWKAEGRGPLAQVNLPEDLAGYQTYQRPGLPPTPICAPGLASIEAALAPDTTDGYKFFVAIPDGGGTHDFSKTFEEHEQKLRKYGYTG